MLKSEDYKKLFVELFLEIFKVSYAFLFLIVSIFFYFLINYISFEILEFFFPYWDIYNLFFISFVFSTYNLTLTNYEVMKEYDKRTELKPLFIKSLLIFLRYLIKYITFFLIYLAILYSIGSFSNFLSFLSILFSITVFFIMRKTIFYIFPNRNTANKYSLTSEIIFKDTISVFITFVISKLLFNLYVDNYIFLVVIFSLLVNFLIFKIFSYFGNDFIKKEKIVIVLFKTFLILVVLISNSKILFFSFFVIFSYLFYFYRKRSDYFFILTNYIEDKKKIESLTISKENILLSTNVLIELSKEKNVGLKKPYLIELLLTIKNNKLHRKRKNTNSFQWLISELDRVFSLNTEINRKIDFIIYFYNTLIKYGYKTVPMFILAYMVYVYEVRSNDKDYLRDRIKEMMNKFYLKTPKMMVEFISLWQWIVEYKIGSKRSIKKMPSFVKKRLKLILEDYSELTLRKNKLLRGEIKLKDLIKLLHPKPRSNLLSVTYSGIIQDTKISKLKTKEYVPLSVKNEEIFAQNIDTLPIRALLRNLSNVNFENELIVQKIHKRLTDLVINIKQLKRFVNIFDFYLPIFSIPYEDIIKISRVVNSYTFNTIISNNFKDISFDLIESLVSNMLFPDYKNIDTINKIASTIDYLLTIEEIIKLNIDSVSLINQNMNVKKIKSRDKIKQVLNHIIDKYYENNKKQGSISIFLRLEKDTDFSNLAKLISYFTSVYSSYRIFVLSDSIYDYTKYYKNITENIGAIDRYLRTFCILSNIKKTQKVISVIESYAMLHEFIKSKGICNFIVIDSFNVRENKDLLISFSEIIRKDGFKMILYDYYWNLDYFRTIGEVYYLSSYFDIVVCDIIERVLELREGS